jgi:hypothetical protein
MTNRHTPGPWLVWDSKGTERIDHTTGVYRQLDSTDEQIIALCDEDLSLSSDEQLANARLIAAAPELLEALEELAERAAILSALSPRSAASTLLGMAHTKAKRAIAKARGE